MYGVWGNGAVEFICGAEVEKQMWKVDLWTWGEGEMYGRSNMETYITVCQIAKGNLLYGSGNSNRGFVST